MFAKYIHVLFGIEIDLELRWVLECKRKSIIDKFDTIFPVLFGKICSIILLEFSILGGEIFGADTFGEEYFFELEIFLL